MAEKQSRSDQVNGLNTHPNLGDSDEFYRALIDCHDGLTAAESHSLNARLLLLLSNHIGSLDVLRQAMELARANTVDGHSTPSTD
ncbi:DUF2783 domain-containing protein [Variovorax sp. J22R133]|uniref:DUF2783 domain-containing protein n=1 Tax=Variovorax brevis TaxID=3053503 RepID=UPI0025761BC5|nr:DUF2783 domain-containing protein [Variovorax sp. J22R133]MDM0116123.1 DUF2783 domain-containing protein [Variovorax sp. J22R133]